MAPKAQDDMFAAALRMFRSRGIRYSLMTDAAGEQFFKPNLDDIRRVFGEEAVIEWERLAKLSAPPQGFGSQAG